MLQSLLLVLLICLPNVFGAVLTTTRDIYFPFNHNNHNAAISNGELFYVGDENGVTTYLLTEPQTPGVTATFIEGEHVAVIIASLNPSFVGSYSCDVEVTQAVCLIVNSDPLNGSAESEFTTDTPIDTLALLLVGLPGETPQPTSSASPTPSASPSSAPPANQNPPPSTMKGQIPMPPMQTSSSQSSPSSQSSQASDPSQPAQSSQTINSPPTAASGGEIPSQSSQATSSQSTEQFPSSSQGSDQNFLPSGSTKAGPTITLGISSLLTLVLLHASLS